MFRFLRRVFIILVLLVIVFFIFRLVKPEATSRFVDKIRTIPTTVSSRFHREKKTGIVINGDTTYSSGNFEIGESSNNNYNDYSIDTDSSAEENNTTEGANANDLLWLEELNREINAILASGNNKEGIVYVEDNEDNTTVVVETEPDIVVEPEPDIIENTQTSSSLGEIIGEVLNNGDNNTQTESSSNQSNNTQTNTSTILTEQQWGDCAEAGLTVKDCEDLIRDFGNYN